MGSLQNRQPIAGANFSYDKESLVTDHLQNIVKQYPNEIAVINNETEIDYYTLDKKANQLAHYLIANKKIKAGDFIGVYFAPSIELIISILAIIKSGAAYIPLDLNYPESHINHIIENSNPKLILTNLQKNTRSDLTVEFDDITSNEFPEIPPPKMTDSESPLYLIYTSGSTGQPKGVLIPHRAVINHMLWMCEQFNFKTSDKILLKTPLTFDPSVWEIFAPLFSGAKIVIGPAGSHIDTTQLLASVIEHQITTVQFVPSILGKFLDHPDISQCKSLKWVFVGGESLPEHTKRAFFRKMSCTLINLYGPSETTIDITYHIVKNTDDDMQQNYIGRPVYNSELYIFKDGLEECEPGEDGELYIGGESLGIGYLNKPDLTKVSFIPHPFAANKYLYRTGDIVRYYKNGNLEYRWRKDKQIKINGVRVELSALTSKILEIPGIADCFIDKHVNKESFAYLVCYLVPKTNQELDITYIKNFLSSYFPKFVIPKEYFIIDQLPILPNGKLDIKQLESYKHKTVHKQLSLFQGKEKIDEALISLSNNLLDTSILSIHDDLHETGIDSLSCLVLIEQIEKKFHVDLLIHEILSHRTIEELSKLIINKIQNIDTDSRTINNTVVALKTSGNKTPLFLIHPIGGTVFWYNNLANYIDKDRPLYAIQDPGIECEDYLFDNIEEMASFYCRQIKKIQPKGPYIIGGASFGATVAIEICRHFSPDEIVVIPVLDGWGVYPEELKDENYFRESMKKQQEDWATKFSIYCSNEYQKLFEIQRHRLEMLYKYKMKKVNYKILLFKAKEIMDIFKPINSPDNNWTKYAMQGLQIIEAEGNHETMFQNHYAKSLANQLSKFLDETDDCI